MVSALKENSSPPNLPITCSLGLATSWALATLSAHIIQYTLRQAGIFRELESLIFSINNKNGILLSIEANVILGILIGLLQWVVFQTFLNDAYFRKAIPWSFDRRFSPPFIWWMYVTVFGYFLSGIVTELISEPLGRMSLEIISDVYLSEVTANFILSLLHRLTLSFCQGLLLRKWFGNVASLWIIINVIAYAAGFLTYFFQINFVMFWLIESLIAGFGLILVIKRSGIPPIVAEEVS